MLGTVVKKRPSVEKIESRIQYRKKTSEMEKNLSVIHTEIV